MGTRSKNGALLESTIDYKTDSTKKFDEKFLTILNDVSTILEKKAGQSGIKPWITSLLEYNVPNGKQIRGKLVESAFIILSEEITGEKVEQAQILGWCIEILQAGFLIVDDLMDNGITRRGQPCWYKVKNMGNIVANDAIILEHLVYQIIKLHFGNSNLYSKLLDLILGVNFNTTLGQSLDTRYSAFKDKADFFDQSAMQLYHSIAQLKTSYYTIYLPIALAMVVAGVGSTESDKADCETKSLWENVEDVALKIGTFFQIQDDYFDCFADMTKTGKEGSDIQEGKCSWLYAKAMELSDPKQKEILLENYGMADIDKIACVKKLYSELELPDEFLKIKIEMTSDILASIDKLNHPLLQKLFEQTFDQIFERNC